MPRRVKEEEKTEMIIRGLLKQPDNRRCINCNSLGPQYVCTTFWTFVCTNCSGVHREFTHRVKSVSMAKFSDEEIMSLQAGGNERAKQIYFKKWDPNYNSYPDSSNLQRLRQFVNNVYVDRMYAGDNTCNKQQLAKSESKSSFCEWPSEKSQWGRRDDFLGRSPTERGKTGGSDEFYDRNFFEKSSSAKGGKGLNLKDFLEERIPRNSQAMPRSSSHRSSRSARFEIVDDRFREDGSVKRYERNSVKESGSLKSTASLPVICPVNVILGDKSPELRVGEPPVADEGSAKSQKAADADVDVDAIKKENEAEKPSSLIDFLDEKSEANSSPPKAEKIASDTNTSEATAIVPVNSIESLLFELSAPMIFSSPDSSLQMSPAAKAPAQLNSTSASDVEATEAPGVSNSSEALAVTVVTSDQPLQRDDTNHMMQDIQTHHQPPICTLQNASSVESSLNEQGNRLPASDDLRRTRSFPAVQSLEVVNPSPCARKEIPENLFSSGFPSFPPAVAGWQMHMPHGAGYSMQFHPHPMHLAAYPNPSRPNNPFDIDDRFQAQTATFPSMSPMQGAHPNMPSPYAAALSSQSHMPSYGMNMMNMPLVPGAYMAQLSHNMLLTRPEGNANFGRSEDTFASLNPITRGSGPHSVSASPTPSLPRGGNPFG